MTCTYIFALVSIFFVRPAIHHTIAGVNPTHPNQSHMEFFYFKRAIMFFFMLYLIPKMPSLQFHCIYLKSKSIMHDRKVHTTPHTHTHSHTPVPKKTHTLINVTNSRIDLHVNDVIIFRRSFIHYVYLCGFLAECNFVGLCAYILLCWIM